MTAFAAIIEPDVKEKTGYLQFLEGYFAKHYPGQIHHDKIGVFACCWNTGSATPLSIYKEENIQVLVLGHIDAGNDLRCNHAHIIADHFIKRGLQDLAKYSGYFLAILCDGASSYVLTDRLGLFPCYFAHNGGTLLIGSSPELPCFHPGIGKRFNLKGLIGHLLYMHEVLGETLWEKSHRLGVGKILCFREGNISFRQEQTIPVSDDYFGLPYSAHIEMIHEVLLQTFGRLHDESFSLLFSGGLDSRTIAAYLNLLGITPKAVYTIGNPSDQEFRIARRACKALKWPQTRIAIGYDEYRELARCQIINEQLANGLNDLNFGYLAKEMPDPVSPLVNGFIGDPVIGGTAMKWAYDPDKRQFDIEKYFRRLNRWGLRAESIQRLIPDSRTSELIYEINNQLKDIYHALPGYEFQKVWQFHFMHRLRYHIAGTLRRFAPSLWPVMPFVTDDVLALAGGMPASTLSERKLQRDLIIRKFPKIAHLPIDGNNPIPYPLKPSPLRKVQHRISLLTGLSRLRTRDRRNLYYYRIYDINNAGWKSVRREAYAYYDSMAGIVDLPVLREILPNPDINIYVDDGIIDSSGAKTLLGFILWHKEYSETINLS